MNRIAWLGLAVLALSAGAARAEEDGKAWFLKRCAACHQSEGQGRPEQIPPLVNSPFLLDDDPGRVARLILTGKAGMPEFHMFLADEQIAAILTYARSSWGNKAGPITTEIVAEQRKELGDDGFRMIHN